MQESLTNSQKDNIFYKIFIYEGPSFKSDGLFFVCILAIDIEEVENERCD